MPVTDPISDMLTRIRNAIMAHHETVSVPASKMKNSIAKILKEEGFIQDYRVDESLHNQGKIQILLYYREKGVPAIMGLKRVSKPGLRMYVRKGEIPRYYGGLGVSILSTSKGVMTGKQAWRDRTGGELLCYVW
jgi:small subunit ribosomal protein S8